MIILDTMVVVEPLRVRPSEYVIAWLDAQAAETLCITALSLAEIIRGLGKLPAAARQNAYGRSVAEKVTELFGDRILPFDTEAAKAYAGVIEEVRRQGFTISRHDGQLAATAASYKCTVASGEITPFAHAGIRAVNPWLS